MTGAPLIALTTDFGWGSSYVAQLKGVLLDALPGVQIVDVAHSIAPQSIRWAELLLRGCAFAFPRGTTHLVIVDPGVGTQRRPIAVRARGTNFVGPDNGVLGVALAQPAAEAVVLDRPEFFRQPVSATFHGRDIFAPVAAELAGGLLIEDVGSRVEDIVPSTLPVARVEADYWVGEVLAADRFGNLLSNLCASGIRPDASVHCGGTVLPRYRTYGEAPPATPFALEGSDGFVEIAVQNGSAAAELGDFSGMQLRARRAD